MIELRIAGVPVRVHPLMALLPLLGLALGLRNDVAALLLSLAVHESGHLMAARFTGVRVSEMTVMPFGCGIQLGNLYVLSPGQVFAVSAGGPIMSCALLFACGALTQWGLLSPAFAVALTRVTLPILLFNLLPALPLDGGRMLYAMMSKPLGRDLAVTLCAGIGDMVSALLMIGTVMLWFRTHQVNLALPACAVFMLKGIQEDRAALRDAGYASLLSVLSRSEAPVPMHIQAISDDYPALKALRHTASDAATLFAIYQNDRLTAFADERELLKAAMKNPAANAGDAVDKWIPVA